jgi:diguanylate cyclase (GGDEF)-like protein
MLLLQRVKKHCFYRERMAVYPSYKESCMLKNISALVLILLIAASSASAQTELNFPSHSELEGKLKDITDYRLRGKAALTAEEQASEADKISVTASSAGYFDIAYKANSVSALRLVELRRFKEVEQRYRESLEYGDADKYPLAKMRFLTAMMKAYSYRDDMENAGVFYEKADTYYVLNAFTDFEKIGILSTLAETQYWLGEFRGALARMREVFDIIDARIDDENTGLALKLSASTLIANMYFEMGDYEKALEYYTRGLNNSIALDDKTMISVFKFNIALAYYNMDDWENVKRTSKIAANAMKERYDFIGQALSLEFLAYAQAKTDEADKAIENQRTALRIYQESEIKEYEINALSKMAYIYTQNGMMQEAESVLMRIDDFPEVNQETVKAEHDFLRANYYVAKNMQDYARALEYHELMRGVEQKEQVEREALQARRLMVEYEVDIAEERSASLEKENTMKTLMLEKKQSEELTHRMVTIGVIGVCFLVMIMAARERVNRRKMHELAMTDPLTGAPNRRAIEKMAMDVLSKKDKEPMPVALGLIDLDHFKKVNDTYGHDVGDEVLKTFVNTCKPMLRHGDVLGRFGGEEFLLLLPNAHPEDVQAIFERLQNALRSRYVTVEGKPIEMSITMSMGASFESSNRGAERLNLRERLNTLIKLADEKVYHAKNGGRDQLVMSDV